MKSITHLILATALLTFSSCSSVFDNPQGNSKKSKSLKAKEDHPCVCIEIYAPVCGKNGKTYSNSCVAACDGQTRTTQGECL
tara:strand:+ start:17230 stop:17475 length:246 start_codon:yes stop_codon:yes gene_type:complete